MTNSLLIYMICTNRERKPIFILIFRTIRTNSGWKHKQIMDLSHFSFNFKYIGMLASKSNHMYQKIMLKNKKVVSKQ